MLSISQRDSVPLGDENDQVNATQYDHEPDEENMEVVGSNEAHTTFIEHIHNDHAKENMVVGVQAT